MRKRQWIPGVIGIKFMSVRLTKEWKSAILIEG